ncbi:MAG: ABC transporter ATP-binding protein [Deltaproteobacteria bacterium]|nr:ABC transporter ATP-binding protein [Deltaproteobacteria bacterium]
MSVVISLDNVSFAYNGRQVLSDVDLTVQAGDFLAVVGPNGGGKSTLLKIMLGLLAPNGGVVKVLGQPPAKICQRLGYLPQQSHLDLAFPITVGEVVEMGRLAGGPWAWPRRSDHEAARQALAAVGLPDLSRRHLAELSGGQRQRVLIARALVSAPEILLLDEPTSNLDPQAEKELYELLGQLRQKMTLVMVTHDLGFVPPHVRHVACVNQKLSMHPTEAIHGEVLEAIYGPGARLVRHDQIHAPCGPECEHV